jgi:oligoribonuclease NrnB/cAMP/cGMP phosphodiesterase (DHH superfamily)
MNKKVVVHDTDNDGRIGLYLWQGENPNAKWLAHTHGEKYGIEEFEGKDVTFIDCCYDYDYLCEIREVSNSIKIFDHHRIDPRILEDFECHHDLTKSATLIVHEHLYPNKEVPEFVMQVNNRDLWKKEAGTDYWYLGLNALFGMFGVKEVFSILDSGSTYAIRKAGLALYPLYEKLLENGHVADVKVNNTEYITYIKSDNPMLSSDISEKFYTKKGCYAVVILYNTGNKDMPYGYGLRTSKDIDLSVVAKKLGGGGHAKACGFKSNLESGHKELAKYIYENTANNTDGKLII